MLIKEEKHLGFSCPQRVDTDMKMFPCLGSYCMAFRKVFMHDLPEGERGYCGLAGKPLEVERSQFPLMMREVMGKGGHAE